MATMMVSGHELGLAEEAGLTGDEKSERAFTVRDAVLDRIGSDRFAQALIDADFDMPNAEKDDVVGEALKRSGYDAARRELFPEG